MLVCNVGGYEARLLGLDAHTANLTLILCTKYSGPYKSFTSTLS